MSKDKCVICGDPSPYDFDVDINYRHFYVEGAGQLCQDCYLNMNNENIAVPKKLIKQYPNDSELGQKVRELYYKKK